MFQENNRLTVISVFSSQLAISVRLQKKDTNGTGDYGAVFSSNGAIELIKPPVVVFSRWALSLSL